MRRRKSKKPKDFYEIYSSIRKDWGNVNPVERIEKDKKKYSRKRKRPFDYERGVYDE